MTATVQLKKKNSSHEPQAVWSQDELIGDKPRSPEVTLTLTLTLS
jgi:hypothetical protein